MPQDQRFGSERGEPAASAVAAARVSRLRDRFGDRYDAAQWGRIAEAAERSVLRGIALRRFDLANHDEPDPRFVAWQAEGNRP